MRNRMLVLLMALALSPMARAHGELSELSEASVLPVAVSVAAPGLLLSGGLLLAVHSVEASAEGTVWVLERLSDGVQFTLRVAGRATRASLQAGGTVLGTLSVAGGTLLVSGARVIAFVPNTLGRALLHHECIPASCAAR